MPKKARLSLKYGIKKSPKSKKLLLKRRIKSKDNLFKSRLRKFKRTPIKSKSIGRDKKEKRALYSIRYRLKKYLIEELKLNQQNIIFKTFLEPGTYEKGKFLSTQDTPRVKKLLKNLKQKAKFSPRELVSPQVIAEWEFFDAIKKLGALAELLGIDPLSPDFETYLGRTEFYKQHRELIMKYHQANATIKDLNKAGQPVPIEALETQEKLASQLEYAWATFDHPREERRALKGVRELEKGLRLTKKYLKGK